MKSKIFIDGAEGTTGLQIYDRLKDRKDIELITIDENLRKDTNARAQCINSSDITILCLPDSAAKEAIKIIENDNVRIIDASTAHRTDERFVYGFPEIGLLEKIKKARFVSNPGCHATGAIALIIPLIESGILGNDFVFNITSLTGHSGGGKSMIAEYQKENLDISMQSPRIYGLSQNHKHIPEIIKVCNLKNQPIFMPVVGNFYNGMAVSIPLNFSAFKICDIYKNYYKNQQFIKVCDVKDEGLLPATIQNGTNNLQITVCGNENSAIAIAIFDNLGKGASGACEQNLNIMLNQ